MVAVQYHAIAMKEQASGVIDVTHVEGPQDAYR